MICARGLKETQAFGAVSVRRTRSRRCVAPVASGTQCVSKLEATRVLAGKHDPYFNAAVGSQPVWRSSTISGASPPANASGPAAWHDPSLAAAQQANRLEVLF